MKKGVFWIMVLLSMRAFAVQQTPTVVLARAIAKAEGFGVKGSVPTRCHNPGDIRALPGTHYPGQVGLNKSRYVIFKNDSAGWAALQHQLNKIANRESTHYTPEMSIRQLARVYGGDSNWVKAVAHSIGVPPGTTIAEYFDLPPVLVVKPNQHVLDGLLQYVRETQEEYEEAKTF